MLESLIHNYLLFNPSGYIICIYIRIHFIFIDPDTKEWLPFPTPSEFAQYFIDEIPKMGDVLNVNRHFAAQYTQCPFCSLPYDLVGKKETFDKDIQILFENLEITDICDTNLAQNKAKNQGQEEDNTLQFFSQISKSMSRKIFDYYKLDFDLFGYDKAEVFKYIEAGLED